MGHRFQLNSTTDSCIRETFRGHTYLRPHGPSWIPAEYHFHTPSNFSAPDSVTPCGCMVWKNDEGTTVRCALLNRSTPLADDMGRCNPAACALMTAHRMWSDTEPYAPQVILGLLRARGLWVYPYMSTQDRALYGSVLTVDPGDGTRMQVSVVGTGSFAVIQYPAKGPLVEWQEDRL